MSDVIEKMSAAWEDAYEKYWAKHWASDTAPGFKRVLRNSHLAAMRAAVAALADNVGDEMACNFAADYFGHKSKISDSDVTEVAGALSVAIRSLLQKENQPS